MGTDLRERVAQLVDTTFVDCTPTHWVRSLAAADAILALVRDHMTSDEAVERARSLWFTQASIRAAILAALEGGKTDGE
jgi:predicted transcriptional regulator